MKMTGRKRALDKIYKRRNRYEIPEWQREDVWDRPKKQKLIDSILRGWKLPKFYLLKTSENPEEFEVLDGQQRLISIFEFFDNELPLTQEAAEEFGGEYYKDLPPEISDNFDDFEIDYDEIEDPTEDEQREFFQRLQAGLPLTSSEKLNSAYSKLRDFARTLSKHRFFKQKVTASNRRYGHFDIAVKVAALAIEGMDAGLRYDDLKLTFESQRNFSPRSNVASRLNRTFDCLSEIFTDNDALLKNRTQVQSFSTLIYRICDTNKIASYYKRLRRFFQNFMDELARQVELGQDATDPDYIAFQKTVNANVRGAAKTREQILLRKLIAHDPSFLDLLDPSAISESGLSQQVTRTANTVIEMVGRINAAYAAKHGKDLFKATNKTAQALTNLGKPVNSLEDYKRLVDDLYFLFHEGVGGRLDGKKPRSFVAVNDLRTDLQHDVDHGKTSKASKKRRTLGTTFRKLGGSASPQTLAPERFPAVQHSVLAEILADLRELLKSADKGTL